MASQQPRDNVYVVGVGMTKFSRPRHLRTYTDLGFEAGVKALLDAGIKYDVVEAGVACYCFGDTCSGQRTFYQFGMTGIPIYNVNNACATGSTGLHLARTIVGGGTADCVMVIGFETMDPGSIKSTWHDKPDPLGPTTSLMHAMYGSHDSPRTAQFFANAAKEYMSKYGAEARDFAEVGRISHEHSSRNPYAQYNDIYSIEDIEQSAMIHYPLTKLQCSPTSDGAGAAIIVSERFLRAHPHLRSKAILIAGQALMSDTEEGYSRSAIELVGFRMCQRAALAAFKEAGIKPRDIKVCEVHDCFSSNELITMEALGFCNIGEAHLMLRNGDMTYGGQVVVNPSGGLISKGHPLGATGLAQCCELVWQLRGWATNGRLVNGVGVALQHNLGLIGAVAVTIYKRADGKKNTDLLLSQADIAMSSGLGYNPAIECKEVTLACADKVRSKKHNSDVAWKDTRQTLSGRL